MRVNGLLEKLQNQLNETTYLAGNQTLSFQAKFKKLLSIVQEKQLSLLKQIIDANTEEAKKQQEDLDYYKKKYERKQLKYKELKKVQNQMIQIQQEQLKKQITYQEILDAMKIQKKASEEHIKQLELEKRLSIQYQRNQARIKEQFQGPYYITKPFLDTENQSMSSQQSFKKLLLDAVFHRTPLSQSQKSSLLRFISKNQEDRKNFQKQLNKCRQKIKSLQEEIIQQVKLKEAAQQTIQDQEQTIKKICFENDKLKKQVFKKNFQLQERDKRGLNRNFSM